MGVRYAIHPSIGIARVGNSPDGFYLAPDALGALPTECDPAANPTIEDGRPKPVSAFKDAEGRIRRQAALFKIFAYDDTHPRAGAREVTLGAPEVERIEWTAHMANKKAAWYASTELCGNLMLGEKNSYGNQNVPRRNAHVTGVERRRHLIIDPGPRVVDRPRQREEFGRDNGPSGYTHVSFPAPDLHPFGIDSLGAMLMNDAGHLAVLGGHGHAGGRQDIQTYVGADSWYDDISDGPVTCRLTLNGSAVPIELTAWVIVAPPKFAPELRNISTLDDVMYDVGVRFLHLVPDLYDETRWAGGWNPDYTASYARDIQPIIERPGDYVWVANVPSMIAFSRPRFDPTDASAANRANREAYFAYFREPGQNELGRQHEVLLRDGIPMMPVNSGTNSVTDRDIDKFMSLTLTQYMLLKQWAAGAFSADESAPPPQGVSVLDQASVGNCVGHPMSPGVEVSWNMRNPNVYERPYRIRRRADEAFYAAHGLDPNRDECEGGGCEPGDLTKRMSPPWQSDLYQCSVEWINFTKPDRNNNDVSNMPDPPTFYAYWWPPQAPVNVMTGADTAHEQQLAGVSSGYQVPFLRGIDNIARLVVAWSYLGFIVNDHVGPNRHAYPYFVERQRDHGRFAVSSVAVGQAIDQMAASGIFTTGDNVFTPMWHLKDDGTDPIVRRRRRHRL